MSYRSPGLAIGAKGMTILSEISPSPGQSPGSSYFSVGNSAVFGHLTINSVTSIGSYPTTGSYTFSDQYPEMKNSGCITANIPKNNIITKPIRPIVLCLKSNQLRLNVGVNILFFFILFSSFVFITINQP